LTSDWTSVASSVEEEGLLVLLQYSGKMMRIQESMHHVDSFDEKVSDVQLIAGK
jgi:hypothetical protein